MLHEFLTCDLDHKYANSMQAYKEFCNIFIRVNLITMFVIATVLRFL
jgi:hypothetical protein